MGSGWRSRERAPGWSSAAGGADGAACEAACVAACVVLSAGAPPGSADSAGGPAF